MASHGAVLGSSSTCLACLRRLANPLTGVTIIAGPVSIVNQTRAKSRFKRPQDQGVIVRLLEDIPKFGRKEAIFRVERGRMRNEWYPKNKAEYMTAARFQELGLNREDVGERDSSFIPLAQIRGSLPVQPELPETPPPPAPTPVFKPETLNATQTRELLETLPQKIEFLRKPVATSISPLVGAASEQSSGPIFGSVTALDVANEIKKLLVSELDARPISFGPENIRFPDLEEGSDRIKALGNWTVEIAVEDALQEDDLKRIHRTVEVLPME